MLLCSPFMGQLGREATPSPLLGTYIRAAVLPQLHLPLHFCYITKHQQCRGRSRRTHSEKLIDGPPGNTAENWTTRSRIHPEQEGICNVEELLLFLKGNTCLKEGAFLVNPLSFLPLSPITSLPLTASLFPSAESTDCILLPGDIAYFGPESRITEEETTIKPTPV